MARYDQGARFMFACSMSLEGFCLQVALSFESKAVKTMGGQRLRFSCFGDFTLQAHEMQSPVTNIP